MKTAGILLAVVLAGTAWGQVSPDEAMRRLEERKAAAATRPSTGPTVPELRLLVAQLQKTIDELQAENRTLRIQVAANKVATTRNSAKATAPEVGMEIDEALALMPERRLVYESAGMKQFKWSVGNVGRGEYRREFLVTFSGGIVESIKELSATPPPPADLHGINPPSFRH